MYFFTAGRYEYRNKGIDVFIEALQRQCPFFFACLLAFWSQMLTIVNIDVPLQA